MVKGSSWAKYEQENSADSRRVAGTILIGVASEFWLLNEVKTEFCSSLW